MIVMKNFVMLLVEKFFQSGRQVDLRCHEKCGSDVCPALTALKWMN